MATGEQRVIQDFRTICEDPPLGVSVAPKPGNFFEWDVIITGPECTAFENGAFKMLMTFPREYPARPPQVKFTSEMFHPNIYSNGYVCIDILGSKWQSIFDAAGVLVSIQCLLLDPNPESPANGEAATLYKRDRVEYERRVLKTVEKSWL